MDLVICMIHMLNILSNRCSFPLPTCRCCGPSLLGAYINFCGEVHKETCSFHLLVGEVTITLDNVALLLHLPITGAFHNFEVLHVDKVVCLLVELLEVSSEEAKVETIQCHETYVQLSWL